MAARQISPGYWVSLNEYLQMAHVSLSTARRWIKAGKVQAKLQRGKYYIYVLWRPVDTDAPASTIPALAQENHGLRQQVLALQQENADLKMLVQAYERQLAKHKKLSLKLGANV